MIILTYILQIFLHSDMLLKCAHIVKINTPKIYTILKVEINLSVLTFMYLSQIASDLSKHGLKSKLEYFLFKSKVNLIIEQKPFVLWAMKRL